MKCYNHNQADAVAICKNCNKTLCQNCLTEIEDGIACKSTCVEKVQQLNELINKNKLSSGKVKGAYSRNAYIYMGFGLVFIIYGLYEKQMQSYLFPMGIMFL
jgi:hypothetical protein